MQKNKKELKTINLPKSINKNIRSSCRKIDLILKIVVGKKVQDALRDLTFANRRIAKEIQKTIHSAIANAENNLQYDIDNLFIKEAYTGKSIVMKRFRPRAKGRASPIKKPYSRLTIILSEKNIKTVDHGTKS